jgi:hypothetical protein
MMKPSTGLPRRGCVAVVKSSPTATTFRKRGRTRRRSFLLAVVCGFLNAQFPQSLSAGIVSDDGTRAYFWEEDHVVAFDLSTGSRRNITDPALRAGGESTLVALRDNQLVGCSRSTVWTLDPTTNRSNSVVKAKKGEVFRNAVYHPKLQQLWGSIFPAGKEQTTDALSFDCSGLQWVSFKDGKIALGREEVRRDLVPLGATFDENGHMYFPLEGDVFKAESVDGSWDIAGARCVPLSTMEVDTGGGSPSTYGARQVVVSRKHLFLFVNRLGGSGDGFVLRVHKPETADNPGRDEADRYVETLTRYQQTLSTAKVLQAGLVDAELAVSESGKHVVVWSGDNLWKSTDDDELKLIAGNPANPGK